MAPQIVQDVIDWIFGKRRRKNWLNGNRASWSVPGYGPSGSRSRRASDRLLPDIKSDADTGRGPVGQRQKVVDFEDRSSIDEDAADHELAGAGGEFTMIEEEGAAEHEVSDVDDELLDIGDESSMKEEEAFEQKAPDLGDKSYVDEITGIRVLRFVDESPAKMEVAAEQRVPDRDSDVSPAVEMDPGEISPDISTVPFTEKETPSTTDFKVASEMPVIPMDQAIYKEGQMSDTYYIARDNSESSLVRQLHPECSVMIPADYDTAIEEIKTCPLDCPYKALELAEIDQKMLRTRIK